MNKEQYQNNTTIQQIKNNDDPINLFLSPGIGDILFCMIKLIDSTDKSFNIYSWERDMYSSPFLLGMDRVKSVQSFKQPFKTYEQFKKHCNEKYKEYIKMSPEEFFNQKDIYLEANTFLENGNRVENYLPNLTTSFNFPWKRDEKLYQESLQYIKPGKSILVYTSSIKNNNIGKQYMGNWNENCWVEVVGKLYEQYPEAVINIIGAKADEDIALLIKKKYPVNIHLDKPAEFIIPMMYNSNCFFGYQSGLNCCSQMLKIPTYMLYFNVYSKLRKCFCPPELINNEKIYKPVLFNDFNDSKQDLYDWVKLHIS